MVGPVIQQANSFVCYYCILKQTWRLFKATVAMESISKNPSEYFKDHCYVAVEADEYMGGWVAEQIGDDNIVFSTDFPHEDSRYPHAVETFLELPFSEASKRKILWDNSARLYGLG